MLRNLSRKWASIELVIAAFLAAGITMLILLNVVTRAAGFALFWVDEFAIYTMIWMTFFTASAAVHYKSAVAVTIMTDVLPYKIVPLMAKLVDVIVFVLAVLILWFCWRWFLPMDLANAGFDIEKFQGETFNFIYSEITNTLPFKKFWVWLIVWVFSFGLLLHSTANLFAPYREDEAVL